MAELTPFIDEKSAEPIYIQLYRYIRKEMVEGRIVAGTKLPSVRELAQRLSISRTPIALAYDQLQAEGYVRTRPRSGIFAEALPEVADSMGGTGRQDQVKREGRNNEQERTISAGTTALAHEPNGRAITIDFGVGAIDWSKFPAAAWRKWMNECLQTDKGRLYQHSELQGERELREEIAAYLHRTRGVRCTPESIVIGAGTYHSLDLALMLIYSDGSEKHIASEAAVNEGVQRLFKRHQLQVQPIMLEADGIAVDELHHLRLGSVRAAYVTPSHQYPLGMTLSVAKRMKLLQWAAETGGYIIENDYDGEFRYAGRPIPALQGLDEQGSVVYVGTFSQAVTPSFRLSYAVLPPALLTRFQERRHSYDQFASPVFQHAMRLFMSSGGFGRHMRTMRALYQRKRDTALHTIRSVFQIEPGVERKPAVTVIGEHSGLHMLLRLNNGLTEQEMIDRASAVGVSVYPISGYWFQPSDAHQYESTVLIGFGGLSEEAIRVGLARLAKAWGLGERDECSI
ncbi:MocR-like pyridoxine biosynthesis transcription factor PdxR [Paenibacillus sp. MMS18-CY102]|uniref:MocR-like pyridoxine biosynthesis transcription factor PdxR n=1 Tax=Paenibacillus sp. MMS18-CY102 TaxID=2682849 RepID=UPI001365C47A|nr:PLP-dependent aminotransferase family protein [Paenibacillus sp. MMS18-CY102]MWC28136.1 aminotransferase class I/II-fold pyridoxal phosphate-dependent enzyme [Paenibacillus sp. MMS18-CY102]